MQPLRTVALFLTAALLVPAALADRRDVDLPEFGEPADVVLSPAKEYEIGSQVVAQMYAYDFILEDPELQHYLSILGWKLAAQIPQKPQQLNFFLVKDPRINAFALPGGFIGFNAGLITASESESEVAGVMAHELTHVTQRHIARTIQGTKTANIATWLGVLAAIIAGSANPDVVLAALSLGQGLSYQNQVNYTRAHELEADRLGIRTMVQAGFDPEGMASFFIRLEQKSRLYGGGLPEILRTHPVNTTRVSEARQRASQYPQSNYQDSLEYSLMRSRVQVLIADRPSQAVEHFGRLIAAGETSPATLYGHALALQQLGQYDPAIEILEPLLKRYPDQVNLRLARANILLAQGNHQPAMAEFARIQRDFPKYAPAVLEYAEALMQRGDAETARQLLLSSETTLGTHLQTYRLLSQAARATGDTPEAAYQMANYLFARGNAPAALRQLDAGLRIAGLDEQVRAKLQARRAEVRETLPKNFRDPELDRGGRNGLSYAAQSAS